MGLEMHKEEMGLMDSFGLLSLSTAVEKRGIFCEVSFVSRMEGAKALCATTVIYCCIRQYFKM